MMEQTNGLGLVHLYWGEGKGKTTAAMGLALRALGSGCKVTVVQFLKGADTGEVPLLRRLGAEVYRGKAGQKFVFQMDEEEKAATRALQTRNLQAALAGESGAEVPRAVAALDMTTAGLTADYPRHATSLMNLIKNSEETVRELQR